MKMLYLGGMRVLCFVTLFSFANVQLSYSQQWVQLGGGADDLVITIYHDSIADLLYVGGSFDSPYQGIMNWDGTSFNSMGNNALEYLTANDMIHYNGNLVVVGSGFPPQNEIYHTASWDGNSWTQMSFDYGTSSALGVFEVDTFQGDLYAVGTIHRVDSVYLKNVIRWNDSTLTWDPVNRGIFNDYPTIGDGSNGIAMTVYNNELYVGGDCDSAGIVAVNNVAKWDGNSWAPVGNGVNSRVLELIEFNGKLYAATNSDGLHEWDGTTWTQVATMDWGIGSMHVFNNELYVGGSFTLIAGNSYKYIAKWDGQNWDSVGTELDSYVMDITNYHGALVIAGNFTSHAGGGPGGLRRIATLGPIPGINDQYLENGFGIYPNPTTGQFTVQGATGTITVHDLFGRLVLTANKPQIDMSAFPKGVYIVRVGDAVRKLVVQ